MIQISTPNKQLSQRQKCLAKFQPLRITNQQKSLNLIKKWPTNGQMKLCSTLGAGEVFENQPKGKAKLSTQISSIKITKIPWYRLPTKYQYLKISSSSSQWWILHEIRKFIQKLHTWIFFFFLTFWFCKNFDQKWTLIDPSLLKLMQ